MEKEDVAKEAEERREGTRSEAGGSFARKPWATLSKLSEAIGVDARPRLSCPCLAGVSCRAPLDLNFDLHSQYSLEEAPSNCRNYTSCSIGNFIYSKSHLN